MEIINNTANAIISEFLNPLIYLLSAVAFAWFLYGVVVFLWAKYNSQEDAVKKGKNHMLWGLIGLIIIFSASGIYNFISKLF